MREGCPPATEAVAAFLADLELAGRSPATISTYRSYLRSLTDWPDTAGLRALILVRLRVNARTAAAVHAVLASFFEYVHVQGWAPDNPMRQIPRPRAKDPEHRYLSKPEIVKVWQACNSDDTRLIVRLLLLGLRARELLGLTADDVHGNELRLRVTKGGKPRRVYLDAATLALLSGRSGRLVPCSYASLRERITRLGERAGVPLRCHDFRRTFATGALLEGMSISTVKELGGWSGERMIRYYARSALQEAALRDAERFDLTAKLLGEST